jgi:hypothetical protein
MIGSWSLKKSDYLQVMVLMSSIFACGHMGFSAASEEKLSLTSASLQHPIDSSATFFNTALRQETSGTESFRRNSKLENYERMKKQSNSIASHDRPTTSQQSEPPRGNGGESTENELENAANTLRRKYEYLEDLDNTFEGIKHQLLLQEENFMIHEIKLTDKLVEEGREKTLPQTELHQFSIVAKKNYGRFRMGLENSYTSMAKELEQRTWWATLVDFFNKVLRTSRWKRKQISLNLRKLRSKLREPQNQFSDEQSAAVYGLSILD